MSFNKKIAPLSTKILMFSRQKSFDSQVICRLYSNVLSDFMTRRQSKVQHFILYDFIRKQPGIGQHLATELINYCGSAAQPYRRVGKEYHKYGVHTALHHLPIINFNPHEPSKQKELFN